MKNRLKTITLSEWQFFPNGGRINWIGTRKSNRNNIKVRAGWSRRLLFLFRKWKSLVSCMSSSPTPLHQQAPRAGEINRGDQSQLYRSYQQIQNTRVRFHFGYFVLQPTYELLKPARLRRYTNQRILLGVIYPLAQPPDR